MKWRLLISIAVVCLVLGVAVIPLDAQGFYGLVNGSFDGSAWGWSFVSTQSYYTTMNCRSANGCVVLRLGGGNSSMIYSSPVLAGTSIKAYAGDYDEFDIGVIRVSWVSMQGDGITTILQNAWSVGNTYGVGFTTNIPVTITGDLGQFVFQTTDTSNVMVYLDDVTCATCLVPGFPYGLNTPIPIDWTRYPTPLPYPTFPPFPTAIQQITNNTTNTTNNTTNNYGSSGSGTTIVVSGTGQTINAFPYGEGTPVPIMNPTPRVTAIAARMDLVSVGSVGRSYNTGGMSGVIPVNVSSGGTSQPSAVAVEERPLSICLPSEVAQIISLPQLCWNISVWSVTGWTVAGIDLLPWFSVVLVALFIVFILRQLQER